MRSLPARLSLETLEDRCAPGNLGGYIGADGVSLLTDAATLSYKPTTHESSSSTKSSSQSNDLWDMTTISARDRDLLQTVTRQAQNQGGGAAGKGSQQTSQSVTAATSGPGQDLLQGTKNLLNPFGTKTDEKAPEKSKPAAPSQTEPKHSADGGSSGPIASKGSTPAPVVPASGHSISPSASANPLPVLPAVPTGPTPPAGTQLPIHLSIPSPPVSPPASPPANPSTPSSSPSSPTSLTPAQQAALAINQTGIDLFQLLAQQSAGANLAFSPYSLSTALAMLYAGANGQTATQMEQVLNFLPMGSNIHADFAALLAAMQAGGTSPQDQLSTANAIWVQQGLPITSNYANLLQSDYGSSVNQVDFSTSAAAEQARQTINSWVSQQTNGMIPNLIPQGALTPQTELVLTNAVYFNAVWSEPFNPSLTQTLPFQVAPGQSVMTPMMNQTDSFGYYAGASFAGLSMNYQGNNQSMVVLLPNQGTSLASFEQTLSAANLTNWLSQMQTQRVDVSLPKFQAKQTLDLGSDLSNMGMPLAFSSAADFSGIDGGTPPLQVSQVLQQVAVNVSEQSTKASAATAIIMEAMGAGIATEALPPVVFNADQPFVYLIRDNSTGAILFMGQETNPTE